ncbi:MAG: ABC transporter ATP-binding protein [Verrucomicrobiae bacterium]|nr:ABC transporter ATP-binding protein [Verrucomicrobiae bacterium]
MSQDLNHLDLSWSGGLDRNPPQGHELAISGLSVRYGGVTALEDVSLTTHCGRCLALVGPNGAGKSSLMKAMAGLITPTDGVIAWRGRPLTRSTAEIAYLAQRSEVDWHFPVTVRGLVEMGRYPHVGWWRRFGKIDRAAVNEALETMRLADLADRQIGALSGGQQQRAFVARALAQEAHVLLLDEPFTGLDRPSQELLTELLRMLAFSGRLVVAAHHDLDTVPEIFDEVLLVNSRRIAFGPVDSAYTAENIASCFGGTSSYRFPSEVLPLVASTTDQRETAAPSS